MASGASGFCKREFVYGLAGFNAVLGRNKNRMHPWHLRDEDFIVQADRVLADCHSGRLDLWAPDIFPAEVCGALIYATLGRQPRISVPQGLQAVEDLLDMPVRIAPSHDLVLDAYLLAQRYGSAAFDAVYLALAQRLAIPFITADRRLYLRIAALPNVLWLGSYHAGAT